jgi:ATP-dependent RNA helicase HelY
MQRHPCHRCPDREAHARWAERYWKLKRETDRIRKQIENRTGTVARVFDRVIDVLTEVGYVQGSGDHLTLTDAGRTMQRIYGERDLLVAESLRRGLWHGLDAPSLAAMACALVYEPRRDDGSADPRDLPRGRFRIAWERTQELWAELDDLEHDNRLPGSDRPSAALSGAIHAWARGSSLDAVLEDADMAAGDFVRWAKQTIDLLDQLSIVAPDAETARTARAALDGVRRGIVAYSSM